MEILINPTRARKSGSRNIQGVLMEISTGRLVPLVREFGIWMLFLDYCKLQWDPAFKKVDFKKVRHCVSEKVSSYKKVFSLNNYHFLILS